MTLDDSSGPSRPQPPRPLQRRPHGSGDAWVTGPDGRRFWGTFGAAGLLVIDPDERVLLQHRVEWSHFGGTWGLPGGARHEGESALDGAIREANEEAGVPETTLQPAFAAVLDLDWWTYTTVVARASEHFTPVIGDAESIDLRWLPADQVDSLPLHPGLAASWPTLRSDLATRAIVIVDSANVVGSRPDGWWRDRVGANARLAEQLDTLETRGTPAEMLGLAHDVWWPEYRLVVEGQANAITEQAVGGTAASIIRSPRDGDSAIVGQVESARSQHTHVFVVTADRELSERVHSLGAATIGPGTLLSLLES